MPPTTHNLRGQTADKKRSRTQAANNEAVSHLEPKASTHNELRTISNAKHEREIHHGRRRFIIAMAGLRTQNASARKAQCRGRVATQHLASPHVLKLRAERSPAQGNGTMTKATKVADEGRLRMWCNDLAYESLLTNGRGANGSPTPLPRMACKTTNDPEQARRDCAYILSRDGPNPAAWRVSRYARQDARTSAHSG